MKNFKNLKEAKGLSRKQLKEINGGWDSGYCARLRATGDCHHPNWAKCGFGYYPPHVPCITAG